MNRPVLLFLRSFGDFTIAISVLRRCITPLPFRLVASIHLKPLYVDLVEALPDFSLDIEFVDLKIKHKILGLFTNRHLLDPHVFVELMNLRQYMYSQSNASQFLFEQCKRLWIISPAIGFSHDSIHKQGNVYDSYCDWMGIDPNDLSFSPSLPTLRKILILPESRKPDKALPQSFVKRKCQMLMDEGHEVTTAFYKQIPWETKGKNTTHLSFHDLIKLVQEADEIISADSLPAHLAQFLQKPHHIIYRKRPDPVWLTPFAKQNKSYSVFS